MMSKVMPKRIATTIMNSLKGGVVPRVGLEYIAVGRTQEINALLHDIAIIEEGAASFRFIMGKYGSGKSFLLQTMRNYAMEKGFAVVDADLSPERRLTGAKGQGLATYKELMQNISVKTKPDGGALPLILEKWITAIQTEVVTSLGISASDLSFDKEVHNRIYKIAGNMEGMVNGFDFARAILIYWEAYKNGDDNRKSQIIKWFRGEYSTKSEAKADLGINLIINDDNWYDFIKLFAKFLVKAGYKGLLALIDELVNIFKIPYSITRQYNYEKILTIYNDVLQGKAQHIGIIMGGTPQCIEDSHKGVFSYEALRSRLSEGRFATANTKDLLAPIIRLEPLTNEEMYVLIEKLSEIHAGLYGYELKITHEDLVFFLKVEYERIGANTHITPREVIRDFIELLNITFQNPDKTIAEILVGDGFTFSKDTITDEVIHEEFAGFEV
jgi:energy-coupling factor transporter ATP-binding protein EcfA2